MKIYEYKRGKVTKRVVKDYLQNRNVNYKILKDLHFLFAAISIVFILLSIVIAFSVISVVFYNGSFFLSIFIDTVAILSSFGIIFNLWSRYKKDLLGLKSS